MCAPEIVKYPIRFTITIRQQALLDVGDPTDLLDYETDEGTAEEDTPDSLMKEMEEDKMESYSESESESDNDDDDSEEDDAADALDGNADEGTAEGSTTHFFIEEIEETVDEPETEDEFDKDNEEEWSMLPALNGLALTLFLTLFYYAYIGDWMGWLVGFLKTVACWLGFSIWVVAWGFYVYEMEGLGRGQRNAGRQML